MPDLSSRLCWRSSGRVRLCLPWLLLGLGLAVPCRGENLAAAAPADPPEPQEPYYFYYHRDYGSDALIHPLRLIINGGYGIMQLENRHNRPFDIDYAQGARNVWRNLRDPFTAIEARGWGKFFSSEIIPVSFNSGSAQYWPNYTQHLLGGGMSYRMMAEWFRWHEWSHPKLWAGATIFVYHVLNEIVENDKKSGLSTDPIADLYIFDPASIWLFSSDSVCRFFSETMHMADWSYQPMYDPDHRTLENNGQNFALKWNLPGSARWSLFYHYGTHGELGLSRTWPDGDCLSAGVGLKAKNLVDIDAISRTVDLAVSAGIFYDRNNSLLASLLWAQSKDYRLRLNVYPGLIRWGPLSPSLFMTLNEQGKLFAGLSFDWLLWLPVGCASRF